MRIAVAGLLALTLAGCNAVANKQVPEVSSGTFQLANSAPKSGFNRVTICGGKWLADTWLLNKQPGLIQPKIGPFTVTVQNKKFSIAQEDSVILDYKGSLQIIAQHAGRSAIAFNAQGTYVTLNILDSPDGMLVAGRSAVPTSTLSLYAKQSNSAEDCANKRLVGYSIL
jgi:hypothetical protein